MKYCLLWLMNLLLISVSAVAQKEAKHVIVCFDSTFTRERQFRPVYEPVGSEPSSSREHSAFQILPMRLDVARIAPPPEFGLHKTTLVGEDEIRPYHPILALKYCQETDQYPERSGAIH